jgi:hypothetical protein
MTSRYLKTDSSIRILADTVLELSIRSVRHNMNLMKCVICAAVFWGMMGSPFAMTFGAAQLSHPGSQYDIGGTLFPTYSFPQNSIVPWRTGSEKNLFSVSDSIGERYYGTAGYALFGTQFSFPNANANPPAPNAFINPTQPHPDFPDIINLPSFITNSQILAARIAAGWSYALIDDPRMQAGPRWWTFDGTNYPPPDGTNTTGVVPYVKLGIIDGLDIFGNNPTLQDPSQPDGIGFLTYRWGFQVGSNVPASFRVGVMTDGLDHPTNFSPTEVHLQHVDVTNPGAPVMISAVDTGIIPNGLGLSGSEDYIPGRNRFVDMHFFDITGAQPGDQFGFAVRSELGGGRSAGIAGFSFDIIDPTTQAIPGDYNNDGFVDAADYTVWRNNLGEMFQLPNEGDGVTPGEVTVEDYLFWKSQYGMGGGSGGLAAVPEPASLALVALGLAVTMFVGTSRRRLDHIPRS